jgi:hypothetical protein
VFSRAEPTIGNQFALSEARIILDSYAHYLKKPLMAQHSSPNNGKELSEELYQATFALVAHDTSSDPIFFSANCLAQQLFEMNWSEITSIPSRQSAESILQSERQALLDRVAQYGYINDYSGIRISKSGRRFWIRNAAVWNLIDEQGNKIGQAACFDRWEYL